jgi:hypothetical protein
MHQFGNCDVCTVLEGRLLRAAMEMREKKPIEDTVGFGLGYPRSCIDNIEFYLSFAKLEPKIDVGDICIDRLRALTHLVKSSHALVEATSFDGCAEIETKSRTCSGARR